MIRKKSRIEMLVSCCGGAIDPARKNDLAYAAHLCCGMHAAVGAAFAQRDEFFATQNGHLHFKKTSDITNTMNKHYPPVKLVILAAGIALLLTIFTGCGNVRTPGYRGRVSHETNRMYAGKFRGQYVVAFDHEERLIGQGYPTWYWQVPQPGNRTALSKIPPTSVRAGASKSEVERFFGSPDWRGRNQWIYEVR